MPPHRTVGTPLHYESPPMNKLLIVIAVIVTTLSASAKEVALQLAGYEALTLTIPNDWQAAVANVNTHGDPECPEEMIVIGPADSESPYMTIYPYSRLVELSHLRPGNPFMRLPIHVNNEEQYVVIDEIHDASSSVCGYYQIKRKDNELTFHADINLSERTWTATANIPAVESHVAEQFVAVVKSMRSDQPAHRMDTRDTPNLLE